MFLEPVFTLFFTGRQELGYSTFSATADSLFQGGWERADKGCVVVSLVPWFWNCRELREEVPGVGVPR